jgi:hypothetical protein
MVKKRVNKKSKSNGFADFFKNKYFVSAVFVLIIVSGFFLMSTLSQSEEAIAGEAYRKSVSRGTTSPYFQLYKEYKTFHEMSAGKVTFRTFNDALMRSNVFYADSFSRVPESRIETRNSYRDLKKLVNEVYAGKSKSSIKSIAWLMVYEDSVKMKLFGKIDKKPLNPLFLRQLKEILVGTTESGGPSGSGGSSGGSIDTGFLGGGSSGGFDCGEGSGSGGAMGEAGGGNNPMGTSVDPMGPTGTDSSGQPTPFSEVGYGDPYNAGGPCGPGGSIDADKLGGQTGNEGSGDSSSVDNDMYKGNSGVTYTETNKNNDGSYDQTEHTYKTIGESYGVGGTKYDVTHTSQTSSYDSNGEMSGMGATSTSTGSYNQQEFNDLKDDIKTGMSKGFDPLGDDGGNNCGPGGPGGAFMDCASDDEAICGPGGADQSVVKNTGGGPQGQTAGSFGCGVGEAAMMMMKKEMLWDPNPIDLVSNNLGNMFNTMQEGDFNNK